MLMIFSKLPHYFCINSFSCSFDCYKIHQNSESCSQRHTELEALRKKVKEENDMELENRKQKLELFKTDDTVDTEKLSELGNIFWISSSV